MAGDEAQEPKARPDDADDSSTAGERAGTAGAPTGEMPRVDFSTLVLSLGTTALYQMGQVPDPSTGVSGEPDALVAKQTIDTLEMLREKTRGNLDEEERKLLDSLLYELRMRFVEISR